MCPVSLPINVSVTQVSSAEAVGPTNSSGAAALPIGGLMPEPQGADIGLVIAQLAIENAFTARKQARHDRQHANTAMIAAQKEQIAHMREEADKRYEAAKFEAWGKIAEGGCGILGGMVSGSGLFKLIGGTDESGLQTRRGWGEAASSLGRVGSGVTSVITAGERHDADLEGAAAKAAEIEATAQKDAIGNADDEIKEAREHIRTALDFLRDFQAAQQKAMSSAIRG